MSAFASDVRGSNTAAAGTTQVKTGPGLLHRIVINKAVASGTITVYDNTASSGTKLATVTLPATLLANQFVLDYGCAFGTGLRVVVAEDMDITVVYS